VAQDEGEQQPRALSSRVVEALPKGAGGRGHPGILREEGPVVNLVLGQGRSL
jgi:hypothetical protein